MSLNVITLIQSQREMIDRQDRDLGVECFADFGGELLDVERFGKKKHSRFAAIARLERFLQVSGDEQNFDVRLSNLERIGKTAATDLWHDDVSEKEIDLAVFRKQTLRVGAVCRFDHFVTQRAQHSHR